MIAIQASQFATRADIEEYVRNLSDKKGQEIHGTLEELRRLQLSPRVLVFGVPVVAPDFVPKTPQKKPERGEVKPSKMNGMLTSTGKRKRSKK